MSAHGSGLESARMHLNGSGDNRETVVIVRASNYLGKLSGMSFYKILQKMNLNQPKPSKTRTKERQNF